MNSVDRRKLRENYVELVRNLNPEDVTDYLYQERVLTEEECETIHSGTARAQRVRLFLSILPRKSKDGLPALLTALRRAGYLELADLLERPLETDDVTLEHSVSPPDTPGVDDPKLMSLKETLEQQSQVVTSMQAEMETLQKELQRQSQSYESNEKYKKVVTVLYELQKEKAEEQRVYKEMCDTYLKDMNKMEMEQDAKPSSRRSTMRSTSRAPSFSISGGIRRFAKIKCVLLGDGGAGKTSIIHYFIHKRKLESYIPTIFDNRSIDVMHKNTQITINFWDTAGQDGYDKLRPLSYADAHVAILVFSVTSQTTLNNALDKWYPELKHYCKKVPFILVGNKTDPLDEQKMYERREGGERFVEAREAHKAAEMMRAVSKEAFLCSAHSGDGIQRILDTVAEVGLKKMLKVHRKTNPCACM